jgi:hypothetical protein
VQQQQLGNNIPRRRTEGRCAASTCAPISQLVRYMQNDDDSSRSRGADSTADPRKLTSLKKRAVPSPLSATGAAWAAPASPSVSQASQQAADVQHGSGTTPVERGSDHHIVEGARAWEWLASLQSEEGLAPQQNVPSTGAASGRRAGSTLSWPSGTHSSRRPGRPRPPRMTAQHMRASAHAPTAAAALRLNCIVREPFLFLFSFTMSYIANT